MFDLTSDQELLQDTTRRFLDSESAPNRLRDLAGTKAGFEPDYWRRGAALGWTSLVVPEAAGGGSVSGAGVIDLTLIAYEFGHHAAPGPLGPVNLVAAAIGRWGNEDQKRDLLPGLLSGDRVAAWGLAEPAPHSGLGQVFAEARPDGPGFVVSGAKTPIEAGEEADNFLITARHGTGLVQFVVPRDTPGVVVTPLQGLDLTRRYARLDLDEVRLGRQHLVGSDSDAGAAVEWLSDLAVVIQLAEMIGAMQWALDTTLEWTLHRYSFGRPLASYQAIKHRMADMKMWLEASYAIAAQAARAVQADSADRDELVSAGKFYVGRYGAELMQECVQLHGGIGLTFDHDLHLFLRRVTANLPVFGSSTEHAIRIGRLIEAQGAG
jgi:alkylation response protein AidB-like acyl-CoA dehydrogenase